MSLGSLVSAVLKIADDRQAMRRFYDAELAWLRDEHPEITDPEKVLRSNIGWCFGEGMPLTTRKLWAEETGAEHMIAGPEFAQRDFEFTELLLAGMKYAEIMLREERYPTAWDRVLQERFG